MFSGAKKNLKKIFFKLILCSLSVRTLQHLQKKFKHFFASENMKQLSSKVAYNRAKLFFSVLPIGPKPAQITFSVPKKCLPARRLYNDFDWTRLGGFRKRQFLLTKAKLFQEAMFFIIIFT